ncbi:MAG: SMI1/KNR4 family protein [Polyangiales bacterium]
MPRKVPDLKQALADLDAAVSAGDREVGKTLGVGASKAALAKLSKIAGELTDDLETWFQWHDGQKGYASIGPSVNDRLLSASAAASAWKFLEEEGHAPWRSSWLPIMENGAGDYVLFDRDDGRLLRYHHEDRQRPKAAASLAAWAKEVAEDWKRVVASTAPSPAPKDWQRVDSPKKRQLTKKPPGTAYHYRATSPSLGKGIFFHLFWKKEADSWFQATNSTLEKCWTSISNNLFPFQSTPDGGAEYCLSEAQVIRDGKSAAHVGLYERHFTSPPFPAKK